MFESQDRSSAGSEVVQNATDKRYVFCVRVCGWRGGGWGIISRGVEGVWRYCWNVWIEERANVWTFHRFFWLALYAQPGLWVALALIAVLKLEFKWLSLVGKLTFPPYLKICLW